MRLRNLGIVVLCGVTLTSVPALASNDLVVPRDFPTIQAAIDAAPPGATIKVRPGIYTEELVIGKDVALKGAGAVVTIIKAPPALSRRNGP